MADEDKGKFAGRVRVVDVEDRGEEGVIPGDMDLGEGGSWRVRARVEGEQGSGLRVWVWVRAGVEGEGGG